MRNEDGSVVVVFNGEIYNYRELRGELEARGHRFATAPDTEVIVHLLRGVGRRAARAPARDVRLRALGRAAAPAAARARPARHQAALLDVAPGRLVFASEIKAILRVPGAARGGPARGLHYLGGMVPAPMTLFAGIQKLPPAHGCLARTAASRRRPYWDVPIGAGREVRAGRASTTESRAARQLLRESVAPAPDDRRPVGVFLSGGIDSSAVGLGVSRPHPSRSRPSRWASRAKRGASCAWARRRRGYRHRAPRDHGRPARPERLAEADGLAPRRAGRRPAPGGPAHGLATGRGRGKVALSGEGGDELFGGYYTYVADSAGPGSAPRPRWPGSVEALPSSDSKVSLDYKAKRFVRGARLPALERHHAWKEIFPAPMRASLGRAGSRAGTRSTSPRALRRDRGRRAARPPPGPRPRHLPGRRPAGQDRPLEHGHSLELRVPFLDQRVAEFALGLATPLKVPRPRQEAAAAAGAGAPAAEGDRQRGPSRGSRSRSRPGCAARSSRSPARRSRRRPWSGRAASTPRSSPRCSTATAPVEEDLSRQLWGLMSFTLWFDRYAR